MPFKSKAQQAACFAKKSRGQAKGWNCHEWAEATPNLKKLPEKITDSSPAETKKAALLALEQRAGSVAERLGVRAGAMHLNVDLTGRDR
jgi:hypothetical protein